MGTQMLNIHPQLLLFFFCLCFSHIHTNKQTSSSSSSVLEFFPNWIVCLLIQDVLETNTACLFVHNQTVWLNICILVCTSLCIWHFYSNFFTIFLLIITIHFPVLYNLLASVILRCPPFLCLSSRLAAPPSIELFLSVFLLQHPPPPLCLVPSSLLSVPPTPPPTRHENGAPLGVPGLNPVWHTLLWSAVSWAKHPTKPPVWGKRDGREEGRGCSRFRGKQK